ncbi:DUF6625 family protein [uncultured Megasphaera sp.]|jgi:hypothetical protein|uniref:DUF6625 family protein n=1 Tax=uncultured Megasphaera sp. TaxID=165188 RepID=UPI00266ECC7B|nr:DUF6625 family protein [uncultured Megasphaera sp.]
MHKYLLICPYFGKLPSNFQLWLNSCSYNTEVNFLILTDDKALYEFPENVTVDYMEFAQLQNLIKEKFPFVKHNIRPYKLCDYKPAYGYLFSDYVTGYDYWGNCDVDLIYGNLSRFLPAIPYDKISNLGHTTFYRNDEKINLAFMKGNRVFLTYREILASDANFGFDEIGDYGIKNIFDKNHYSIYPLEEHVADVSPNSANLILTHYNSKKDSFCQENQDSILSFEKGHIFSWNLIADGEIQKKEYAYVHFQKRKMLDYRTKKDDEYFLIGPHGFYDYQKVTPNLLMQFHGRNIDSALIRRKFKAMKNRIKREVAIKILMKERKQ